MNPENEVVAAVNNYLSVGVILSSDLMEIVHKEETTASWRRNYIRVVAALIEGTTHCLRDLVRIGLKLESSAIPMREVEAIKTGLGFTAIERIELTIGAVQTMFQLRSEPDDAGKWRSAAALIDKGDRIAHPRSPADLEISDDLWPELQSGATWLIHRHFDIVQSIADLLAPKSDKNLD